MAAKTFERVTAPYEPRYERFVLHQKNYVQQYNQLYIQRLNSMKSHIQMRARQRWGNINVLERIIDIEAFRDQENVIIGMLIKDLCLRKSVLDDYRDGGKQTAFQPLSLLASDKDRLILEDQSGRVMLAGSILAHTCQLVTGVVVAVKGRINDDGDFLANDEVFSFDVANVEDEHAASSALPILSLPSHKLPRRLVLFVSGLGLGTASSPVHDLAVQLLVDFVCGRMADPKSADLASRIVRVVLAGDSVQAVDLHDLRERFGNNKLKASLSTPSKQLDVFLAQLLTSCFVDIMPGRSDPANAALPQQPLHPCLFQHAARFNTFERVTNPYECLVADTLIAGHSGQPIDDIARQTYEPGHQSVASAEEDDEAAVQISSTDETADPTVDIPESNLDLRDCKPQRVGGDMSDPARRLLILRQTLAWGHWAPCLPDTAPCYPFTDRDPFIVTSDNLPNVIFAGNQPGFCSQLVSITDGSSGRSPQNVRLVCVPNFRSTATVVLCDIDHPQFPCYTIAFQ